jgi:hypothetical protein
VETNGVRGIFRNEVPFGFRKSIRFLQDILLFSDRRYFKLFFHNRRNYRCTYRSEHQFFVYPHRMRSPVMIAASAVHDRCFLRPTVFQPANSLRVGKGGSHLAPWHGSPGGGVGGWFNCSHPSEVMTSWVWGAECGRVLWNKRMR